MPRYRCGSCGSIYSARVDANLTCVLWRCGNAKMSLAGPAYNGERAKQLAAHQKKRAKAEAVRAKRTGTLRTRRGIVDYVNAPNLDGLEDREETEAALEEVDDEELEREAEDTDFVPTANRWDFGQRLTVGDMIERVVFPLNLSNIKTILQTIAGPIDGERQKDCALIIGAALGVQRVSAWALTNQIGLPMGTRWFAGNKDTAEWCHLVGVSLGGTTVAGNLIAASFAANTYMGVIEKAIQGRTDLRASVTIEGLSHAVGGTANHPHIAEKIHYAIVRLTDSHQLTEFVIDARISQFSDADRQRVEQQITHDVPAAH
jgi:hypothetical protein